MREIIQTQLHEIEDTEKIRIFYACESGSRAWGFPSSDSDYDVRFLYLHKPDWYLSIDLEHKRDVVERPIDGQLDINGWDLRKALQLLRKGNPPLMEWLGSPIVYQEKTAIPAKLRALAAKYYTPTAAFYHYLHMAQGNFREYLKGSIVWIKKYFYVLRPLLAIRWIERDLGVVPTEFQKLVDRVVESPQLKREIDALIQAKRRGEELEQGPRIPPISDFIAAELARLEDKKFAHEYGKPLVPVRELDHLFRTALEQVWSP
jgi:hypothetical protein